jgi:hypothetical protein
MCLSDRNPNPRTILRIGMALLAVALISQRFVHPAPGFGEDAADAIRGFLLGLSIGLNLMAVWLGSRRGWGSCAR